MSSVAEPEPQGAAFLVGAGAVTRSGSGFDGSDSGINHGSELKNLKKFISHLVHIFTNTNRTESYEQHNFNMCLNFRSNSSFQE
jgi:uncharacterized UPF0160 family protein